MPTLPLYTTPVHPDAWHQVIAPGGYEWWQLSAEDPVADVRVVAMIHDGFAFHPEYLRRYAAYLRKPTHIAPPVPREYPVATVAVYEKGRRVSYYTNQYAPGSLVASPQEPRVSLGPNRFAAADEDGWLELNFFGAPGQSVRIEGEQRAGETLEAVLSFRPRLPHPALERGLLPESASGGQHHWVIANPLCDVEGEIRLQGKLSSTRTIPFRGLGCHDHHYGARVLGAGIRRLLKGWVFTEGRAVSFCHALPVDPACREVMHVVQADHHGIKVRHQTPPPQVNFQRTRSPIPYPDSIEVADLVLRNPLVIGSSPFSVTLTYETSVAGQRATGYCEIAYPRRLVRPFIGRMFLRSFRRDWM